MEAAAAQAPAVRVRGVTPGWALAAVAFLLLALVIGVAVGPVDLGVGDVLQSIAAKLVTPQLRRSFLGAEPVADVFRTLGRTLPRSG